MIVSQKLDDNTNPELALYQYQVLLPNSPDRERLSIQTHAWTSFVEV